MRTAGHQLPAALDSHVVLAAVLIGLAFVSGRLLGIRVSWPRALAAGLIGTTAGEVVYYAAATPDVFMDFAVPGLVTTMLALTVTEIAYRPGSLPTVPAGLTSVPRPLKSARSWLRRTRRYTEVLGIAARNGLNPYLRGHAEADRSREQTSHVAIRLRRTFEECGGVFVKLGQVLSTRPDLLPASYVAELSKLQDAAPPVPFEILQPILDAELGARSSTVFAEFDQTPIAAASIAQVHRARLRTGEDVVVKIARPGISGLVDCDLEIIQRLAGGFAARAQWARHAGVIELAERFATAVREETDFRIEAGNVDSIRAAGCDVVRVPRVFSDYSTSRVLVMEWLDGVKVRDSRQLLSELTIDRREVARKLLRSVLRQIMVEGVFHADLHPGNVLILRDGTPALIDFGSVGRLNAAQQSALRRMLAGVDRRDAAVMRDALSDLADIKDTQTQHRLEQALSQVLVTRLGPGMRPGAELFGDVLRLLVGFELALPGDVAAVFRCLMTLEGTLALIAPDFQVIDESRAMAGDLVSGAISPLDLPQMTRDELLTQLPILRRLPRRMDQLAATIDDGRLTVRVSLFDTPQERHFVSMMVGRSIFAFLGASIGIISAMLLGTSGGPDLVAGVALLPVVGHLGLLASALLVLRVIVGVAQDRSA